MPPVGNLPQLPLVARRPVRAYGMPPVGNLPPVVPTTGLAEVNDARAMSRFGNLPQQCLRPDSPRSTTQGRCPGLGIYPQQCLRPDAPGQRRKGDVPVSRLMVCGNLFPCRVQIPQWPCNDEMATRNRHVHVLGQVHRVRCGDRPGAL
jgi:hypothetical protein